MFCCSIIHRGIRSFRSLDLILLVPLTSSSVSSRDLLTFSLLINQIYQLSVFLMSIGARQDGLSYIFAFDQQSSISSTLVRFITSATSPSLELQTNFDSNNNYQSINKMQHFVGQQTSLFRAKIKYNLSSDHSPYPALFSEESEAETAVSGLSYSSHRTGRTPSSPSSGL